MSKRRKSKHFWKNEFTPYNFPSIFIKIIQSIMVRKKFGRFWGIFGRKGTFIEIN
jgi:hypothetical protein